MSKLACATILAGLVLVPVAAESGLGGNCSPEGTWYGYNTEGAVWLATISRSGPQTFTFVLDWGANAAVPPSVSSTDWRGEAVKTGPDTYYWPSMAQLRLEEGFPFPYAAGYCPGTVEFTGCDSWQAEFSCVFFGYFHGQDPFVEGVPILVGDPAQAFFTRMPMSLPE